jgi:hypothetical protein
MKFSRQLCLLIALSATAVLSAPDIEDKANVPLRMANGAAIEGTVQKATPEGLIIQGERGSYTAPWKYLSPGTRYRYERPMLAAQEEARQLAIKKAAAAAAKKKSAAAKAAAKATTTNAIATNSTVVVSNTPPAKK